MVTAFRDGFQSVVGARVFTKDFMPAVEAAHKAGIRHFEFGGGARFQSPFFYCGENAFDSMDEFRRTVGQDVNLQTLARGINVVGLDSQSSDIIDLHAKLFKKHGTTTIRNFDALNDVNNLIFSGQCIKKHGLRHEIVITMMALPPGCEGAHTPEFYIGCLDRILAADVEFDSLCFKDASGTATPSVVYETVRQARAKLGQDMPIVMHTHETAGTSVLVYRSALDAGASQIDLGLNPMSGGTGQPDVLTMWHALRGTEYELGFDVDKLREAEEIFKNCMKDYFMPPEASAVEPLIPWSPMPGGALTANTQMLRDNGIMDKYDDCIKAMSEVVCRGGFGTSVTPVSQFYFQQAFNNVMFGPWKKIAEGYGKMVLGYFGKTPVAPDEEIVKLAADQLKLEPTTQDPRLLNDGNPAKGVAAAKKKLTEAGITDLSDENIFIAAACGDKGIAFLKGNCTLGVRKNEPASKAATGTAASVKSANANGAYCVTLNGKKYNVQLDGGKAVVNGRSYNYAVGEGFAAAVGSGNGNGNGGVAGLSSAADHVVKAPLPGVIVRMEAAEGDSVSEGDVLMVMEAMKMETEIKSQFSGTIARVLVKQGDQINASDELVHISA